MISPGFKPTAPFSISGAGRSEADWILDLEGMTSLGAMARFSGATGGNSVKAFLQTSFDQGNTPIDIACFAFGTDPAVFARNLTSGPVTTNVIPTDGTLPDNTSRDGLLGDRVRWVVIVDGPYAGSPLFEGSVIAR